jgi:alkanesulfonate monooxygenase SsuD/methylene tetrahydromethanopterin reductase-like flavin-dependent oxidoreductase (luciferase family)
MRLAEEVATLDHLSRRRMEFAPGVGVLEHELLRWKSPFYERRERSREALEIIVKAWTDAPGAVIEVLATPRQGGDPGFSLAKEDTHGHHTSFTRGPVPALPL